MKKLLSLALVLVMVLTMSVTAFAQEITGNSGSTDITHTVSDSYIVTIPDSMTIGTDANVSVSDVTLAKDYKLAVSVSSAQYNDGWKLKNGDDTIGYTLKIDNTDVANNGTVLTAKSGETATKTLKTELSGTAKYSGTYKDTLTFNVSVSESNTTTENTPKITGVSFSGDMVSTDTENKTYTITVPADGNTVWPTVTVTGTNLQKIVDDNLYGFHYYQLMSEDGSSLYPVLYKYQYNYVDETLSSSNAVGVKAADAGTYKLKYSNDNAATWVDTGWTVIIVEASSEQ